MSDHELPREYESLVEQFKRLSPQGSIAIESDGNEDPNQLMIIICVIRNVERNYSVTEVLKKMGYNRFLHWQYGYCHKEGDKIDICYIMMGKLQDLGNIQYHYLPTHIVHINEINEYPSLDKIEEVRERMLYNMINDEYHEPHNRMSELRQASINNLRSLKRSMEREKLRIYNSVDSTHRKRLYKYNAEYNGYKAMIGAIDEFIDQLTTININTRIRNDLNVSYDEE